MFSFICFMIPKEHVVAYKFCRFKIFCKLLNTHLLENILRTVCRLSMNFLETLFRVFIKLLQNTSSILELYWCIHLYTLSSSVLISLDLLVTDRADDINFYLWPPESVLLKTLEKLTRNKLRPPQEHNLLSAIYIHILNKTFEKFYKPPLTLGRSILIALCRLSSHLRSLTWRLVNKYCLLCISRVKLVLMSKYMRLSKPQYRRKQFKVFQVIINLYPYL